MDGNPVVPVVMDFDAASERIRSIYILDIDSMSDFNIPEKWPYDWSVSSCSKFLKQEHVSVEYAG